MPTYVSKISQGSRFFHSGNGRDLSGTELSTNTVVLSENIELAVSHAESVCIEKPTRDFLATKGV